MKVILASVLVFVVAIASAGATDLKSGDIIFHTSKSSQSLALQLAMRSPHSHMGLILIRHGKPFVFEASKNVRYTPLKEWVERGEEGKYVVKRLRNDSLLNEQGLARVFTLATEYLDKPYDPYFEWSDDRIYCSELVWKIYYRAFGIEIGDFQTFREFDLSHPIVKAKLEERFGVTVPMDEKVISPSAMFNSNLLATVRSVLPDPRKK